MTDTTFPIDINLLKAVRMAASYDETRYYLKGVYIEPADGYIHMTATNGNLMLMARQEAPGVIASTPFIVPNHLIDAIKAKKVARKRPLEKPIRPVFNLIVRDGLATIEGADGLSITKPLIDGFYPDYRRVIPTKFDGVTAQFNTQDLNVMHAAQVQALGQSESLHISHNDRGPALVSFCDPNGPFEWFGILMPWRTNRAELNIEWARNVPRIVKDETTLTEKAA